MINRSRNNLAVLKTLNEAELLLSNTEIAENIYPIPITMSNRVTVSNTLMRLIGEGYVQYEQYSQRKRGYEITDKGTALLKKWENG